MFITKSVSSDYVSSSAASSNPIANIHPGVIIAGVIIAFIITIVMFVLIAEKKKAPRGKFTKWLREFLNFRSILISGLIKFFYLFAAVTLTIMGIIMMFSGRDNMILPMIGIGFAIIVFGNVFLRLLAESMMIMIGMWENTSDIRAVLVKDEEAPEEKEPKEKKNEKKPEEVVEIAEVEEIEE